MGRKFRPFNIFLWILGGMCLVFMGLAWQLQSSHAQGDSSPTPDPSLIFYPTVESTGLPPIVSRTPTATVTSRPSATATISATAQPSATVPATLTATNMPTQTNTAIPQATETNNPTVTATLSPTVSLTTTAVVSPTSEASATATATLTATDTATVTFTDTPSPTATPSLTNTPTATFTPSVTPTATITPSPTSTTTRVPSVIESSRPDDSSNAGDSDDGGMPIWIFGAGLVATLLIGGYILAYSLSGSGVERYADGFILDQCPICQEGYLELEERPYSVIGIPRVRRAVRCDNCRSVLREVGQRQWRYAIDPSANVALYSEFNNQTIDEKDLIELAEVVFGEMPDYLDEEE